jgi:hypothetical protein
MTLNNNEKFEVLTAVTMTSAVFEKVMSCSLVKYTRIFEEHVVSFFVVEEYLLVV